MTDCDWSTKCDYCNEIFIGKDGLIVRSFHTLIRHGGKNEGA